jgi:hypothetical protein
MLSPRDAAFAACDPAAASNVTATCTGATVDQGGGAPGTSAGANGYGTGAETNLTVTVVPGASVTGTTGSGIIFDTGTVTNFGTISGAGIGIEGVTSAVVTNSGTIMGGFSGIAAGTTANVVNSAALSQSQAAKPPEASKARLSTSATRAALSPSHFKGGRTFRRRHPRHDRQRQQLGQHHRNQRR